MKAQAPDNSSYVRSEVRERIHQLIEEVRHLRQLEQWYTRSRRNVA